MTDVPRATASAVSDEQARQFANLFAGHGGSYGSYDESGEKKRVKTIQAAMPTDAWAKHLAGDGPYLGVVPIREDSTCRWGCIDLDDDGIDLDELEAKVVAHELPIVVCRSKSGGAHLYCFSRESVPAQLLFDALKKWRQVLGHEKNANGKPVEIFPKQTKLAGQQLGNWVNMPYYDHEHTVRYAVTGGRHLSLDEFFAHTLRRQTDEMHLHRWADPALGPFAEGPPCLQTLHQIGFPEGGRNSGLLNVATFFKLQSPAGWDDRLREYNAGLPSPVDDRELDQIIRNTERHDYAYTCKQYPIESHCQAKACKKQPFGIGFFAKKARLDSIPELGALVKIKTDPPSYRLTVNDVIIPLSNDQLQNTLLFKRVMFERLNLVVSMPRPNEWDEVLRRLAAEQTEEEAPMESGQRGLMLLLLNDFLVLRVKADGPEDLLRGLPWLDPESKRVYFRATDLMAFLQRRQFKQVPMNELYAVLTDGAGLRFEDRNVKGATVKLWSVPEPIDEQSEAFTVPERAAPGIV